MPLNAAFSDDDGTTGGDCFFDQKCLKITIVREQ